MRKLAPACRNPPVRVRCRAPDTSRANTSRCPAAWIVSSASDIVPFNPAQQPVVKVRRRIHAVGVSDQRPGQRTQITQPMPVRRGPRLARTLPCSGSEGGRRNLGALPGPLAAIRPSVSPYNSELREVVGGREGGGGAVLPLEL